MTVADLAHEAAKRYCATLPLPEWADSLADALGVPPAARAGAAMDELCATLRRTFEDQAAQHLTVPELAALARFYSTPEGRSVARKSLAFTAATRPVLEAELTAWARTLSERAGAGPP
jgi:Uncharacterized protein conserved in bacteria (DUF2059)